MDAVSAISVAHAVSTYSVVLATCIAYKVYTMYHRCQPTQDNADAVIVRHFIFNFITLAAALSVFLPFDFPFTRVKNIGTSSSLMNSLTISAKNSLVRGPVVKRTWVGIGLKDAIIF